MKKILMLLVVLAAMHLWGLDPVYHNNEEIIAELDSLEQIYSDIMMVRHMGYSGTDNQPLYAVKISDNVHEDEDEPAVLFLGQCHAEEVMGVEISMYMINEILTYQNSNPFEAWINNLEIWIWPTHNPEGLQVVTDEWDASYRKNKHDNDNNGIFDFVVGVGQDRDGVDLNRNYSFNWVHSDSLWTPGGNELYDYYRGPSPFSEPEAQAVRALSDEQHFIYSVAWHSSRTGNLSEQVIYPWNWESAKPCADFDFITNLAVTVSQLLPTETGIGFYEPSATLGRNSKAHDWFYNEYGTVQFEIEAGSSNLQPGPDLLLDTIERCRLAPYYMMNRVLGYNADAAMLTGHVTDAVTGEPLQAEYIIEEHHAPSFVPRFSDELYGRFWWPCDAGGYTLHIRKKGYEDNIQNVVVNNSMWATREVALQPLPAAVISGAITFDGDPQSVGITAKHVMGDEVFGIPETAGEYEIDWWEGDVELIFQSPGYATQFVELNLTEGVNEFDVHFNESVELFSENWDEDFSQWNVTGDWYLTYDEEFGVPCAKDTPNRFYTNGTESILEIADFFNFHGASQLSLELMHKFHTEHGYDFCNLEVKVDGEDSWDVVESWSGLSAGEGLCDLVVERIDLSAYENTYARIRFRLITDNYVDDPGWWLSEMRILSATAVDEDANDVPAQTVLRASYPNPFHPSESRDGYCRIDYSLGQNSAVELTVYNLRGQKVRSLVAEDLPAGSHSVTWDGKNNAGRMSGNGVYFYQLKTDSEVINKKMILIK